MSNLYKRFSVKSVLAGILLAGSFARAADASAEASGVITRTFGDNALNHVKLETLPASSDGDIYEYSSAGGDLTVRGSSPVAIASGYYQFLRHNALGIASWTGARLDQSKPWPDNVTTRVTTPYALRYYFNVVTFGYTLPYWDWARWQQEIDWMALHGINMPLASVATEAIGTRVWKSIGLTQDEIDGFYTGPAHLPWQRMGNIAGVDGPLSDAWNDDQIALQHKILDRERALGMHPIAPAFAGFVPKDLTRIYPEIKLNSMNWVGFKPEERNHILAPTEPCFLDIGKRTVQEWEREFGKSDYFLADSFNEMKLPTKTPEETNALLEKYGDIVYRSIAAGDADATWVLQGWIFVNAPGTWTHDALQSLLKNVPDDKMLILDEAIDYSAQANGGAMTFKKYDGYFNKRWIAGYIPNMGGTTNYTGKIEFYARGVADSLAAPGHGRLSGIGLVPEGIENNEVLYELIADTIWQTTLVDVGQWLKNYCRSRYGPSTPNSVDEAFQMLRQGPYARLIDHPRFTWQAGPGRDRITADDPAYMPALEKMLAAADQLKDNPLYRADVAELAALAAGGYAEVLINQAIAIGDMGDTAARRATADRAFVVLKRIDQMLAVHPVDRLDRWVNFARAHGTTDAEKNRYEANAKLLLTLWGKNGEISDYSSRVWSGLISGYYIPRWQMYFDSLDGKKIDRRAFETAWWQKPITPTVSPDIDALAVSQQLFDLCSKPLPLSKTQVAEWKPADMSTEWHSMDWSVSGDQLAEQVKIQFLYTTGAHRLEMQKVQILSGDAVIAEQSHFGFTGIGVKDNSYLMKLSQAIDPHSRYVIRASIRSDGGTDSTGKIFAISKANTAS